MHLPDDRIPLEEAAAAILDEHRRIRAVLDQLNGADDLSRRHVVELVRELVELLTAHFAREESASLLADHPVRFARFAKALEHLAVDHNDILNELRFLLENPPDSPSEDALRSVLEKLERHEAAEREILQRAYSEDLGGGS